ncbi:hypothetical protein HDU93_001663 [Gonapodya sp. JEL0774]|nr:hypothetical protein HDU93_001663 [Gonapodya sp. JEL0774]
MRLTLDDVVRQYPTADHTKLDAITFRSHSPARITSVGDLSALSNLHKVDLRGNNLFLEKRDGSALQGLSKCANITLLNLGGNGGQGEAGEEDGEGAGGKVAGGGLKDGKTKDKSKKKERKLKMNPSKAGDVAEDGVSCPPSSGVLTGLAGSLLVINLSSCLVNRTTPQLSSFSNLRALILSHNNLSASSLNPAAFTNLSMLNTLVLSHNKLGPVFPSAVLAPLVALEKLALSHCGLDEFPDLTLLTEAVLQHKRGVPTKVEEKSLEPTLPILPTLRELRLADNPGITSVPKEAAVWLGSGEILDIGGTGITSLDQIVPLAMTPIHNLTLHRTPASQTPDYTETVLRMFSKAIVDSGDEDASGKEARTADSGDENAEAKGPNGMRRGRGAGGLRVFDGKRVDERYGQRKKKREGMEQRRLGKETKSSKRESEGRVGEEEGLGAGRKLFRGLGPRPVEVLEKVLERTLESGDKRRKGNWEKETGKRKSKFGEEEEYGQDGGAKKRKREGSHKVEDGSESAVVQPRSMAGVKVDNTDKPDKPSKTGSSTGPSINAMLKLTPATTPSITAQSHGQPDPSIMNDPSPFAAALLAKKSGAGKKAGGPSSEDKQSAKDMRLDSGVVAIIDVRGSAEKGAKAGKGKTAHKARAAASEAGAPKPSHGATAPIAVAMDVDLEKAFGAEGGDELFVGGWD